MLGIVIVTHGTLSEGLKNASEIIMGEKVNIATESLFEGDKIENLNIKIKNAISRVDQGHGVIIFTDILSASPYNQSLLTVNSLDNQKKKQIYVIAGVNLSMVLEALNHQLLNTSIQDAAKAIIKQGNNSLKCWNLQLDSPIVDDQF